MSEFTGERVIPGQVEVDLLNEHVARYAFAARLARGKCVLDAGCGAGYGAARLALSARRVVGIDLAADAIDFARRQYAAATLEFAQGDCRDLPFAAGVFDMVVAYEVIEHLQDWEKLLAEARRVLNKRGQLILSTPNRLYYSESRAEPNPFHVHEFDYEEFCAALGRHFGHVRLFLENHADGIVFSPLEPDGIETAVETWAADPQASHFFVAVCSPSPLHGSPAFIYIPRSANVLREREQHIALLEHELEQKNQWLTKTQQDLEEANRRYEQFEREATQIIKELQDENARKTEWAHELEAEQERLKGVILGLQKEMEEQLAWVRKLEAERDEVIANFRRLEVETNQVRQDLQATVDQLHKTEAELEERTRWAQSLDRELTQRNADLNLLFGSVAYRVGKRIGLAPVPESDPSKKK